MRQGKLIEIITEDFSVTPFKDMLYDYVESSPEAAKMILDELLAELSEDDAQDIVNMFDLMEIEDY